MEVVEKEAEQQEEVEGIDKKVDDKDADYWRQQAQQNDANARRERQTREDNEKVANDTKAELTQSTQKLQELEKKIEQQSQYQKMDKDVVDPVITERIAFETACNTAAIMITVNTGIDDKKPSNFADELKALMNK